MQIARILDASVERYPGHTALVFDIRRRTCAQ